MEIRISSKTVLLVLNILSWMIFVGLAIDTCGYLTNAIYVLAVDPTYASQFWNRLDLSALIVFDRIWFGVIMFHVVIVGLLKVFLFWSIVRLLTYNQFDVTKPFSKRMGRFVLGLAYYSFAIAFFSMWARKNIGWMIAQGIAMPTDEQFNITGADVWIFMGVVLLVIASIFKRGVELQSENDLTI